MPELRDKPEAKEKEIVIRIRPRGVLKAFLLVLILFSTFYLGRFSVQPPDFPNLFGGLSGAASVDDQVSLEGAKAVPLAQPSAAVEKVAEKVVASTTPTAAATVTEKVSESTDTVQDAAESGADVGPVLTSYSGKAALAIEGVKTVWKDTYGKITDVTYTLKNNEAGAVKGAYFNLLVEGYDDYAKKLLIPLSQQIVAAGESKTNTVKVQYGFAYSKVSVPDLSNVKITLILYDESGKQINSASKQVNLPWEGD